MCRLDINQNVKNYLVGLGVGEYGASKFGELELDNFSKVETIFDKYYGGDGKTLNNQIDIYCPK